MAWECRVWYEIMATLQMQYECNRSEWFTDVPKWQSEQCICIKRNIIYKISTCTHEAICWPKTILHPTEPNGSMWPNKNEMQNAYCSNSPLIVLSHSFDVHIINAFLIVSTSTPNSKWFRLHLIRNKAIAKVFKRYFQSLDRIFFLKSPNQFNQS